MLIIVKNNKLIMNSHDQSPVTLPQKYPVESFNFDGRLSLPIYENSWLDSDKYHDKDSIKDLKPAVNSLSIFTDKTLCQIYKSNEPTDQRYLSDKIHVSDKGMPFSNEASCAKHASVLLLLGLPVNEVLKSAIYSGNNSKLGFYIFDYSKVPDGEKINVENSFKGEVAFGDWQAVADFFEEELFDPKVFWKKNYPNGKDVERFQTVKKKATKK